MAVLEGWRFDPLAFRVPPVTFHTNLPEITEDTLAGNMSNTIAGRICGYFDLGGGGYTVDGGCSSALLAVAHSCTALVNGDLDFALAGGVDINLDPFEIVGFAKAQALARDDIRPYDQRAAGMLPGEGCGLFVLMREADARAAGCPIDAVIRGWGISSDGAGGITAPEVVGQVRALSKAYECAGYPISTVSLIEGHGTGTTIGDKVEISAILRLLEAEKGSGVCRIGGIKANIGHCKAAAGAAGLNKAVMALKHKVFPPTVNCDQPNPVFGKPLARLRPSLRGQIWEAGPTPRRASISSMGFGGANSHVALGEANPDDPPAMADLSLLGSAQSSELILLAAPTTGLLKQQIAKLIPIAERICRAEMTDLAAALVNNLPAGEIRLAMVAESPWQLADSLRLVLECLSKSEDVGAIYDASTGIFAGKSLANPSLVALFPGQGSQRPNMGEHLLQRFPFVRELYDNAGAGLAAKVFRDTLADDHATLRQHEIALKKTEVAQTAIVASSIAMLARPGVFRASAVVFDWSQPW
jgi:enediyne polyketide synthase